MPVRTCASVRLPGPAATRKAGVTPIFCTGLVNAMEAVLQVSGQAGAVQRAGIRRAAAHGCHGYAQQGNVFAIFEGVSA